MKSLHNAFAVIAVLSVSIMAKCAVAQSVSGFVKDLEGEALGNVVVTVFRVTAGTPVNLDDPIDRQVTGPNGAYKVKTEDAANVTLFFDGRQATPKPVTSAFVPQQYFGGNEGGSIRMALLNSDGIPQFDGKRPLFRDVTDMNVGLPERVKCVPICQPRCRVLRRCR